MRGFDCDDRGSGTEKNQRIGDLSPSGANSGLPALRDANFLYVRRSGPPIVSFPLESSRRMLKRIEFCRWDRRDRSGQAGTHVPGRAVGFVVVVVGFARLRGVRRGCGRGGGGAKAETERNSESESGDIEQQ